MRYALVGDLVWQPEGLTNLEERPLLSRLGADLDPDGTRQNILRMASIVKRIPNMIVVPAHDQRAFADMAELPNVTTKRPDPMSDDPVDETPSRGIMTAPNRASGKVK